MQKKALITGITGQDGSYLAELLLDKGYEVHGIIRRSSHFNTRRIDHLHKERHEAHPRKVLLHYGDVTDAAGIIPLIQRIQPDEVYHLAAQSHVKVSFELPEYTGNADALGTLRVLEAIRTLGLAKQVKFYQASTSELFGSSAPPQNEATPFRPRSPYGAAKLYAHWLTINYREAYGLFASNGILFNHESPRRGQTFVTRKITMALARIKLGMQETLFLGNLDARRDWGYAKDYVEAMWLMLQQDKPMDLVIATGETHSVREFVEEAAKHMGIEITWQGEGINEKGLDKKTGKTLIAIDPVYFRPTEVEFLQGDASKAHEILGWKPKTSFKELVRMMANADYQRVKENKLSY